MILDAGTMRAVINHFMTHRVVSVTVTTKFGESLTIQNPWYAPEGLDFTQAVVPLKVTND